MSNTPYDQFEAVASAVAAEAEDLADRLEEPTVLTDRRDQAQTVATHHLRAAISVLDEVAEAGWSE